MRSGSRCPRQYPVIGKPLLWCLFIVLSRRGYCSISFKTADRGFCTNLSYCEHNERCRPDLERIPAESNNTRQALSGGAAQFLKKHPCNKPTESCWIQQVAKYPHGIHSSDCAQPVPVISYGIKRFGFIHSKLSIGAGVHKS